jgi:hypothetical protein
MSLIVLVGRVLSQLLDSVLEQVVAPLLDLPDQIQHLGMRAEILDHVWFIDRPFVGTELLQNSPDLVVVREPVAVQEVEDCHRVQGGALVRIDERVVGDEQPHEMVRFLVNRLRRCTEVSLLDVR